MKTQENRKLKYLGYSVVFQEVPDEVSLVFNISGCPYKCEGCHSKYLWKYDGAFISDDIDNIVIKYRELITCVCFMGGDQNTYELCELFHHVRETFHLKTCLYSGRDTLNELSELFPELDYIKIGRYRKEYGGLNSKTTNQRMFEIKDGKISNDITYKFWRKKTL